MTNIREKAIQGLQVGDCFCVERRFTEQDVVQFARISRDYNPVHFEKRFAQVKNFEDKICHGLLVGSLLTEIGGQIGWLATKMDFEFKKPVYFGDYIRCDLTIVDIRENCQAKAEAVFTNQDKVVVLKAELFGFLPGEREKVVMQDMLNKGG